MKNSKYIFRPKIIVELPDISPEVYNEEYLMSMFYANFPQLMNVPCSVERVYESKEEKKNND